MLQIETVENLAGFGDKNLPGEHYYSENLVPGQFGLEGNIKIVDEEVDDSPGRFNWFAERTDLTGLGLINLGMYAVDTDGKIFYKTGGIWEEVHAPAASHGNGLIVSKGSLLYARDEYLGLYNGSTFNDTFRDFDTVFTGFRPMELYEDWVLIGNERYISLLNVIDDSFSEEAFSLPSRFVVKAIKSNQTGVLIGANYAGNSVIFLWDVRSVRSISEWIWLPSPIQSICTYGSRWIVTTAIGQFITDGYSVVPLPTLPDAPKQGAVFNCIPGGTAVVDNQLRTANSSDKFNRVKSGLYLQDLTNGLFGFVAMSNGCKADMTMGALFQDSNLDQYISYSTNLPAANVVAQIEEAGSENLTLISPRLGPGINNKVAEGLKLDLTAVGKVYNLNPSASFSVSLKIYNFKRQLWGYGLTNGASATAITLKVDGSVTGYNNAVVGDEVTILSGENAGLVRHIASIANAGTNTETWTLDSALPTTTESGAYLSVQPFQLVKTKSISISNLGELESIYFDIRNRIKGRKFLAKIVFSDVSSIQLAIPSLTFIYDDLGVL